jgi:hypothetical protein
MAKRGRPPKLDENGNRIVAEKAPPEYKAVYWVEDPDDTTFTLPKPADIKIMYVNKAKEYEEGQRVKVMASKAGGLEGSKSGFYGKNVQEFKADLLAYLAMRAEEMNTNLEERLKENQNKLASYYESLEKL